MANIMAVRWQSITYFAVPCQRINDARDLGAKWDNLAKLALVCIFPLVGKHNRERTPAKLQHQLSVCALQWDLKHLNV
jgi:hypothetical protein